MTERPESPLTHKSGRSVMLGIVEGYYKGTAI
jgi:hypothetical protein